MVVEVSGDQAGIYNSRYIHTLDKTAACCNSLIRRSVWYVQKLASTFDAGRTTTMPAIETSTESAVEEYMYSIDFDHDCCYLSPDSHHQPRYKFDQAVDLNCQCWPCHRRVGSGCRGDCNLCHAGKLESL